MKKSSSQIDSSNQPSPPRAFTQGVGLVFQWLGVLLFIAMMSVCCTSSLLSRDTATHSTYSNVQLHLVGNASYTAQKAITLTVTLGVFFGMALAGLGLGFQALSKRTPLWAVALTGFASTFWILQTLFFAAVVGSIVLTTCCLLLAILFIGCLVLAGSAMREMRRDPPPEGHEILPADYKVPYSHMHDDPPEVRYAAELDARRRKLEIQQKELEMLEQKLKRRMKENDS